MPTCRVDDMACGHCVGVITKAMIDTDAGAKVQADLAQHLVRVEPVEADAEAVRDAIVEAGCTPVDAPSRDLHIPARSVGCGCGSGNASCRA